MDEVRRPVGGAGAGLADKGAPLRDLLHRRGRENLLIRRLAWEGRERGKKVLVVTTTHMFKPKQYGVFSKKRGEVRRTLERESIAVAGKEAGELKDHVCGKLVL